MYSFPNFELVHWSMYGSSCCFLTSLYISQKTGKVVWSSHLRIVQSLLWSIQFTDLAQSLKQKYMFFMELPCFIHDPVNLGNWSLVCLFKAQLVHWKFLIHMLDFEHHLASMWNECNCVVVRTFFGIAFLWDWSQIWPFPVLWLLLTYQICWHIECSTFIASCFRIWNSSAEILSPPLAF